MTVLLPLARRPLRRAVHDVRFVAPVPYRRAAPGVRRVYDEVERDFGMLAPPVAVHAAAPEVLAAVWELLRATLLATGTVGRAEKEAVAAMVSRANRCPYCVEVHDASREALGGPEALASRTIDSVELADVATCFEYLNRVVTILLPDSPLPPAAPPPVRRRALALLGTAARRVVAPRPIPVPVEVLLDRLVAAALAGVGDDGPVVTAALDRSAGGLGALLDDPMSTALEGGPGAASGPARLAVLAASAPWRVTADDVEAARGDRGDAAVVALIALGAATAAKRRRAALVGRP